MTIDRAMMRDVQFALGAGKDGKPLKDNPPMSGREKMSIADAE